MTTATLRISIFVAAILGLARPSAEAAFHLVEIEQVVGGVSGNSNAQAIQLQIRATNNNQLNPCRLVAYDAAGANPMVLFEFTGNTPNAAAGARVLLTTAAFDAAMLPTVPTFDSDYTLTTAIPASYFAGGKLVFEHATLAANNYWSIAWGTFTGTTEANIGTIDNDNDGNFGAPFAGSLPTDSRGLLFKTLAFNTTTKHTTNAADFALTAGNATVINAAGTNFVVVPEPGTAGLLAFGALALSGVAFARRRGVRAGRSSRV